MSGYRDRARAEIEARGDAPGVTPIMRKLVDDTKSMLLRGPADAKGRAERAREYAVANMDELHEQVRANFERRGIGYHRAETADDAIRIMLGLLGDAKHVAKSKSMVGEEVGLTHALRDAGIDVLETDIGEYIVDIEGRGPSHITAPAIHLNRARIKELLERTGTTFPDDDPTRLSQFVRDVVGDYFKDCDAGITGANAVIASSGRLAVVENEGNVSLGASHPKLHIAITGMEKVVADEAGALAILEVLAPSATAQPLTSFTHFLADPDPGQQRHVVFVDNGRSRIMADERYRDVLRCIRCGACMNACPVYRAGGGLSYGSPYMGPIGAVISPLLWDDGRAADLPFASSLCGGCTEACPVGIPLHRMLLDLRADAVEKGQAGSVRERLAWRGWATAFRGGRAGQLAETAGRFGSTLAAKLPRVKGVLQRPLPALEIERDPGKLNPGSARVPFEPVLIQPIEEPTSALELFRQRAESLGVEVVTELESHEGDRRLQASSAIASTGSVLLTGEAAARRPLLAAKRVVVELDPATIVEFPHRIDRYLGEGDALILTGASRTADIEKQIVRGIHGSEELVVVLKGMES